VNTWLVVDLRDNRCAVGLLTIDRGRPRWTTQLLEFYASPEAYATSAEIDLSFYRGSGKRAPWTPISLGSLKNLPANYEIIPALFAEPSDRLRQIGPPTLLRLLKGVLEENEGVPVVCIISPDVHVQLAVEEFIQITGHTGLICQNTTALGDPSGFALLDPLSTHLPAEGSVHSCRVQLTGEESEIKQFVWSNARLETVMNLAEPAALDMRANWDSPANLQRAGLALFDLFWRKRILDEWLTQSQALQEKIQIKQRLRDRMQDHLTRLKVATGASAST
jgi:hypothetical protein